MAPGTEYPLKLINRRDNVNPVSNIKIKIGAATVGKVTRKITVFDGLMNQLGSALEDVVAQLKVPGQAVMTFRFLFSLQNTAFQSDASERKDVCFV